jgi:putative nucleotidyltransferase with HDIG domain
MPVSRQDAINSWKKWNDDPALLRHALSVEAAMRELARKLGGDPDAWGIVGILHDIDYQRFPGQHCKKARELLAADHWPEETIRAVESHGWGICTDVEPRSPMEKALYAVDELTGFITACALVRPSKSLSDLEVKSVKNKWKAKNFAAGCDRSVIEGGAERLGLPLEELIEAAITGMRTVSADLGL